MVVIVYTQAMIWCDASSASSARVLKAGNLPVLYKGWDHVK